MSTPTHPFGYAASDIAGHFTYFLGSAIVALFDADNDAALNFITAESDRLSTTGGAFETNLPSNIEPMKVAAGFSFGVGGAMLSILTTATEPQRTPALLDDAIKFLRVESELNASNTPAKSAPKKKLTATKVTPKTEAVVAPEPAPEPEPAPVTTAGDVTEWADEF